MIPEQHKRIFHGLHLEKHLTGRQLARLLYPDEYSPETTNKAYQRVMKQLLRLQNDNLLKSKSYGLAEEKLWSLKKNKILLDLGYVAPKADIHKYRYDHEKSCGDIFVSLALTGSLYFWEGEGNEKTLRWDRKFAIDETKDYYLEVETGSQDDGKLRDKLGRYVTFYRETKDPFHVLFSVKDEAAAKRMIALFGEFSLGSHYMVTVQSAFVSSPKTASVKTRFGDIKIFN